MKKQRLLTLAKIEGCLVIFVIWTKFMFLSMFSHDYRVVLSDVEV